MIADFYSKPLQGALFRMFRDIILGHVHTSSLHSITKLPSEERVENNHPRAAVKEFLNVGTKGKTRCTDVRRNSNG